MPLARKPYLIRLATRPGTEIRRMLIHGPGNRGYGNAMLAGFAFIAILADFANSGTPETLGKVLALNIMLAIPVGLTWSAAWAITILYFARWTGAPRAVAKIHPIRFWAGMGRMMLPMILTNMGTCLDLILLDGAPWLPKGSTGTVYYLLWLLKGSGILLTLYAVQKWVAVSTGWHKGRAWAVVLGAMMLAIALIFLIFVVLLGIPIR